MTFNSQEAFNDFLVGWRERHSGAEDWLLAIEDDLAPELAHAFKVGAGLSADFILEHIGLMEAQKSNQNVTVYDGE